VCGDEYVKSGLNWLRFIGDKEKQGLKIVAAIIKHRGTKKFRKKPKESMTETTQKLIGTKSIFNLNNEALEQYRKEYRQNMYKSAYGVAFGRKETDLADTGILKFKKFSDLPCSKVLNSNAKAYITRWSNSGEENKYVSLVVLVVKGIFTHWKQSLPNDTVSHIKHAWYNQSDVVHNQRVDKIGKAFLESRISRASGLQRPQTTGNLLRRNQNTGLIPQKRLKGKNEKGIDDIVEKRKKFLLRGNGNITGFYGPVDGMVSSYQQNFKP
jgi:hypothetical protein